jgi:sugar O-acyltransferase (sialic acid O-acetyltransferase NeuD family)
MEKKKKLIIVGDSSFAEVAFQYFKYDSEFEVCCFSVEKAFLQRDNMFGLPVIPLEDITQLYCSEEYYFYVATVYTQLNRLRTRLFNQMKALGYKPASYVSSNAFVWQNVSLGEHVFVFENNVIQPFVTIGDNVVLWSGNHIGHHSRIENNCFIASHVVISGHCSIGENTFMGVNATIADQVTVAKDNLIGAGALILKNTVVNAVYKGNVANTHPVSSLKLFKVNEEDVSHEMA